MHNLSRGQFRKTRRKSSMYKDLKDKEIKIISVTLTSYRNRGQTYLKDFQH